VGRCGIGLDEACCRAEQGRWREIRFGLGIFEIFEGWGLDRVRETLAYADVASPDIDFDIEMQEREISRLRMQVPVGEGVLLQ
jgi:hypothetical protein